VGSGLLTRPAGSRDRIILAFQLGEPEREGLLLQVHAGFADHVERPLRFGTWPGGCAEFLKGRSIPRFFGDQLPIFKVLKTPFQISDIKHHSAL
jgi:hypothetical protein